MINNINEIHYKVNMKKINSGDTIVIRLLKNKHYVWYTSIVSYFAIQIFRNYTKKLFISVI